MKGWVKLITPDGGFFCLHEKDILYFKPGLVAYFAEDRLIHEPIKMTITEIAEAIAKGAKQ
jgi:hypothetical protein